MGVLANPDSNQAMVPSKQKRTHAVFCVSSAHRLAPTSKPRFVGEKICLNQVIRSLPASKAVIKKKAVTEYADGLYPAFSASGQDVWLPDYRYNCHGVVVSAVGARCGKAFKASGKWNVVANTHPLALDEERIDWDYAWRLLNNENWWIKSGSGQPFVKVRESLKRSIYLPPLSIQKQFAANLRGVESQISIAQRSLAALDSLVKSRFVEMFSGVDQTRPLEKLIVPKTRISYGIVQPGPEGTGDMGILRPVDIVDGRLCLKGIKRIDRKIGDSYRRTELTGNEILTVVRGATGQTVRSEANCIGMNVTRGIAVIRYDPSLIDPDYLVSYMNSDDGQRYIADHTQGATLQQINIADLKAMPIPAPSLKSQQRFAAFAAQVDKSRFVRDHEMNFR